MKEFNYTISNSDNITTWIDSLLAHEELPFRIHIYKSKEEDWCQWASAYWDFESIGFQFKKSQSFGNHTHVSWIIA